MLDSFGGNEISTAICGSQVTAKICPGGFMKGPVDGQRLMRYSCKSYTDEVEHGIDIAAN